MVNLKAAFGQPKLLLLNGNRLQPVETAGVLHVVDGQFGLARLFCVLSLLATHHVLELLRGDQVDHGVLVDAILVLGLVAAEAPFRLAKIQFLPSRRRQTSLLVLQVVQVEASEVVLGSPRWIILLQCTLRLLVIQALQAQSDRPLLDLPRLSSSVLHLVLCFLQGLSLEVLKLHRHGVHAGLDQTLVVVSQV